MVLVADMTSTELPPVPITVAAIAPLDAVAPDVDVDAEPEPVWPNFGVFYQRYLPRLEAKLRREGASAPEAADAAQEAMVSTWTHWEGVNKPRAYVSRAALRIWRHRQYRPDRWSLEMLVGDRSDPGYVPDSVAEFDLQDAVHTAVQRLPRRQREVIALSMNGATDATIAAALNVSVENVRASRLKGRRTLWRLLVAVEVLPPEVLNW